MLVQRHYAIESRAEVRQVIRDHGWSLLVTGGTGGLAVAHVPSLLDPAHDPGGDAPELVVIGHAARNDPAVARLADGSEVLLVFQGPHGYISPAWYEDGPYVPTWNFVVVHVHGVPEVLEGADAFDVLARTVDHFEALREEPWRLEGDALEHAHRIAAGTLPFRLRATRIDAKAKLSQDKPRAVQERVVVALEAEGPYRQPELAAAMRRTLGIPPAEAAA
jgi:transcriptional regulator